MGSSGRETAGASGGVGNASPVAAMSDRSVNFLNNNFERGSELIEITLKNTIELSSK
jgi:hypothetical protein